ncbi:hypothetical protein [Nocardia pseudovaccinii]|uniref:hypothetical protein n=1 Tax=Nocardia pseudovaccinii TaxID=189540 RepID=UPI0007A46097|nr:hypothetical protein [Nocardia pseudovaccinii]
MVFGCLGFRDGLGPALGDFVGIVDRWGLGVLGVGMEAVSLVIDPIGTIASYGVGFLIERFPSSKLRMYMSKKSLPWSRRRKIGAG